MKSVISKLYYGEICPCEKPAPQTEQCIGNRKIICDTAGSVTPDLGGQGIVVCDLYVRF